jgi:hypothetical protein
VELIVLNRTLNTIPYVAANVNQVKPSHISEDDYQELQDEVLLIKSRSRGGFGTALSSGIED